MGFGYRRYMRDCEDRAIDAARRQIAEDRPLWRQTYMEWVEYHLKRERDQDVVAGLKRELRKVQRALGLTPRHQPRRSVSKPASA